MHSGTGKQTRQLTGSACSRRSSDHVVRRQRLLRCERVVTIRAVSQRTSPARAELERPAAASSNCCVSRICATSPGRGTHSLQRSLVPPSPGSRRRPVSDRRLDASASTRPGATRLAMNFADLQGRPRCPKQLGLHVEHDGGARWRGGQRRPCSVAPPRCISMYARSCPSAGLLCPMVDDGKMTVGMKL